MTKYVIHDQPTHVNAPNAWAVWRDDEILAAGISLSEVLDQIRMDNEL